DDAELGRVLAVAPAATDVDAVAHGLSIGPPDLGAHRPGEADVVVAVTMAVHRWQHDDRRTGADRLASVAAEAGAGGGGEVNHAIAHAVDLPNERLAGEHGWRENKQEGESAHGHGTHR